MPALPTPPIFNSPMDDTLSTLDPFFGDGTAGVAPPATLSAIRTLAEDVHRACTLPYIATALCAAFSGSAAGGVSRWHSAQRVNIGASGMAPMGMTSHTVGSTAAPSQPVQTTKSELSTSSGETWPESTAPRGTDAWPPTALSYPLAAGGEFPSGVTPVGPKINRVFLMDYSGAGLTTKLAPYTEEVTSRYCVSIGGRFVPVEDMGTLT